MHRSCQYFLLDDLELLKNKYKTQQELMFTLNTLKEKSCQIVMSSQFHAKEMPLDLPLANRLTTGLLIKVSPLSRQAILDYCRRNAAFYQVSVADEALEAMVDSFDGSFGRFKKILGNILILCSSQKQGITTPLVDKVMQNVRHGKTIALANILAKVIEYYNISLPSLLLKKNGTRALTNPKFIAIALAKVLLNMNMKELQESFERSESAIRYALAKVSHDSELQTVFQSLCKKILPEKHG
jgi:chromosomal replication initiator protein